MLINEGKMIRENLQGVGYDEKWLKEQLLKQGISDIKDVYVAQADSAGELYYSLKDQGGNNDDV